MAEPFAAALADAFATQRGVLVARARQVLDVAGTGAKWSDDDLDQLLNAFAAMVREALDGDGTTTRDLVLETAIPAALARGETPASMIRTNVTWATLITSEIVASVPEDQREAALVWVADFFGRYACAVLDAAEREQQQQ